MATQMSNLVVLDRLDEIGEMVCPFCGEGDHDRIGLKLHLEQWCEAFINTPRS